MEYHAPSKEWQIKPSTCKGSKKNWAYITSDPTHPELCTGSAWMVLVNGKHTRHDDVSLVSLEQRVKEDRQLAEQRRSSCVPIVLAGATGKHGHLINGTYEPSPLKSCGGWPSYLCQGQGSRSILEFNIYAMSWTVTAILISKPKVPTAEDPTTTNTVDAAPRSSVTTSESDVNKNNATTAVTGAVAESTSVGTATGSAVAVESNKVVIDSPPSLVAFVEIAKQQRYTIQHLLHYTHIYSLQKTYTQLSHMSYITGPSRLERQLGRC